jgi:hypothetical protein
VGHFTLIFLEFIEDSLMVTCVDASRQTISVFWQMSHNDLSLYFAGCLIVNYLGILSDVLMVHYLSMLLEVSQQIML